MSLLRSSLCAAADVLDLVAELADALTVTTERLVIASRHGAHGGVLGDGDDAGARERRGRPGDSPRRSPGRLVTISASETGAARRRPGAAAGSPAPPLPAGRGTGKVGVRGYR